MLKNILNPWKLVPILTLIGAIVYFVNDYSNQRGQIKAQKAQIKTLTDSTAALNKQTKELAQLRYDDSVNFTNREIGYQTTIAAQTREIKQLKQLNTNLAAGIMCREEYGWPIKNKVRIVPCDQ